MIEVNFTLLVQLANFLILMVILNVLLFKPVLKVLDERNKLVTESGELKERLGKLADENIAEYEQKLHDGKQEAMGIRNEGRTEAMGEFRQRLQQARAEGEQELEKARQGIAVQTEESRQALMGDAANIASGIASKLMGRSLGGTP